MNDNQDTNTAAPAQQSKLIGLAPLMRKAFAGVDMKPQGMELIAHAEKYPNDANAMMDLATTLLLLGHRDTALATQMEALKLQPLYSVPSVHETKIRLLALMTDGDLMANTPLEFLVEDSDIALDLLYVGAGIPAIEQLPEHDVLFVAVGEADDKHELLLDLQALADNWPRPVINAPERITHLGRDGACALLQTGEGIEMPTSIRIDRPTLEKLGSGEIEISSLLPGDDFPIIVRPLGSHAGHGLRKVASPEDIPDYLQAVPSDEFYVARFVDYRSADGQFRKYRIILIDGKPFISHMGISKHWMIHYLNAGMTESQEKRDEEKRFMENFDTDFVPRHLTAFAEITQRLGLDYVGIDCGETRDGKLLIFEVDSDMIVHAMDPVDMFPYKQEPMKKLFAAFRDMLLKAMATAPAA
ncbi:RimK family alpha-L-glutamate ligase [Undibacterium sp. CY18W]|uniref:RimK family alpha-L-glutamate ligase n=1 Tax=Undibacterium hunanense TaxID=2762292 RepID=A0ABR6ZWS9_9BURK|nr:RimK family alpha-L-glutamate ligase [Undibacterium hunanense]MBC3920326.1 RimK family alpha-L-glutamate ligase [Undibacterium hunanense]